MISLHENFSGHLKSIPRTLEILEQILDAYK